MRITESRLRQVIQEVLLENMRLDVYKEGIRLRKGKEKETEKKKGIRLRKGKGKEKETEKKKGIRLPRKIKAKEKVAEFNGSLGKNPITGEKKERYKVEKFDETKLPLIENLENKQIALNNDGDKRGLFLKEKDEFFFIKFSDLDMLYFIKDSLLDTAITNYMKNKSLEPDQQKITKEGGYSDMFKTENLKTESDMYKLIDMLVGIGFRPKNKELTF
jgi:hypothetical protein